MKITYQHFASYLAFALASFAPHALSLTEKEKHLVKEFLDERVHHFPKKFDQLVQKEFESPYLRPLLVACRGSQVQAQIKAFEYDFGKKTPYALAFHKDGLSKSLRYYEAIKDPCGKLKKALDEWSTKKGTLVLEGVKTCLKTPGFEVSQKNLEDCALPSEIKGYLSVKTIEVVALFTLCKVALKEAKEEFDKDTGSIGEIDEFMQELKNKLF